MLVVKLFKQLCIVEWKKLCNETQLSYEGFNRYCTSQLIMMPMSRLLLLLLFDINFMYESQCFKNLINILFSWSIILSRRLVTALKSAITLYIGSSVLYAISREISDLVDQSRHLFAVKIQLEHRFQNEPITFIHLNTNFERIVTIPLFSPFLFRS